MIHVIVSTTIKPNKLDEYLDRARNLAPLVEAEAGCLRYEYTVDVASPLPTQEPVQADRVTLIEEWESLAHLEAHLQAPHMREHGPALGALRENSQIRVTRSIDDRTAGE